MELEEELDVLFWALSEILLKDFSGNVFTC